MVLENFQLTIAIVLAIVIWLYHKISMDMGEKEHYPLKLFFFFLSVWFSVIAIYYAKAVAYTNLVNATQNASIITITNLAVLTQYPVMIFMIGYWLVYFIQKVFWIYTKAK